ncbi:hypothetical protein GH714_040558 [Hevea brasiliensis]|uniref:Uncharacterized protein n=1 Tax=Hevea brasiliensis TaxID=3981 RepID=A0A6A6L0J2_HEVBR|nr:hypothetical protein GH714_040558 [Hevea brasiliensis]
MIPVTVSITSRETIKPSSPTPQNLKCFKLSLLDQLAPAAYVPMILYYAPTADSNLKNQENIDLLKKSLSQTLTLFYPLAGRVKENLFIECNDGGVDFIEARVNCTLLDILRRPEADDLDRFLPQEYHVPELSSSLESQMAFQVNIFSCGGMAIGTSISHKLVDGITFTSFINLWASMARGSDKYLSPIFFGSADASRANSSGSSKSPSFLTQTVNLRPRMDPPLPEHTAGNLLWLAIAAGPSDSREMEIHGLVYQVRNAMKKFDSDYVRKMKGENGFLVLGETLKQIGELVSKDVNIYRFTSLRKFQLYEADFGWGKPAWVSSARLTFKNVVVLIENRIGDRVDAWVTLEEQEMEIFQRNQELLSFDSPSQSDSFLQLNSHL